jgi:transcriptional regulator with XRE-family HTH domain
LRQTRHELGENQQRLAERCGLHWSFVEQVERGRRNVRLHNILKLAAALGGWTEVDPGALVQGSTPPQES